MKRVIVLGRLGNDPELKYTNSGTAVCNLSVATSEKWTDKSGEKQEKTEWHRVVVWKKQAENCNQYLAKGRQVLVEGKLETRSWDDKDGNKRYTTEITASNVQFIGEKNSNYSSDQESEPQENASPIKTDEMFTHDDLPF